MNELKELQKEYENTLKTREERIKPLRTTFRKIFKSCDSCEYSKWSWSSDNYCEVKRKGVGFLNAYFCKYYKIK